MPRSRPKSRKTKYLSLRRHLAPRASKPKTLTPASPSPSPPPQADTPPIKQTSIFPIQQDPDVRDPQVASLLFSSTNGETGETLTEILGTTTSVSAGPLSDSCSAGSPGSPPVNGLDTGDEDSDGLARRALRGRQRVEYCCTSSSSEEEVASVANVAAAKNGAAGVDLWCGAPRASLLLKLDYEEILTSWSDRGSLYIDGQPGQVVPAGFQHTAFPVWVSVGTSGSAATMAWTVPEQEGVDKAEKVELETREMRVKRYKDKRQNRLFAKKIRYEVRKLNAEKRPRLKGRFIKAMEDV